MADFEIDDIGSMPGVWNRCLVNVFKILLLATWDLFLDPLDLGDRSGPFVVLLEISCVLYRARRAWGW